MSSTTSCPLCRDGGPFNVFYSNRQTGDRWLVYLECPSCGLIFLERVPRQEEITLHYQDVRIQTDASEAFREKSLGAARHLLGLLEPYVRRGRLLDLGAGGGYYMEAAEQLGWEVYGVDPAAGAAGQPLRKRLFQGTLEDAHFQPNFFEACLMSHTLSHLLDPVGTLRQVFRVLKEGGILLLVIPNFLRLGKDLKTQQEELIRGKHLYLFSPRTSRRMLEQADFEVLSLDMGQSVLSGEKVDQLNIRFLSWLKAIGSPFLTRPKRVLRAWAGKLFPGPSFTVIARKLSR